jgi:hypothetical protein
MLIYNSVPYVDIKSHHIVIRNRNCAGSFAHKEVTKCGVKIYTFKGDYNMEYDPIFNNIKRR